MATSRNQLGIVVTAEDKATAAVNRVHQSVAHLDKALGSFRGQVALGAALRIGSQALGLFEEGVRRVVDAIPDLLHRGEQWADTVHRIAIETGLSSQQASTLAAVVQDLTGTTDGLDRSLMMAASNIVQHTDKLRMLGITQRQANAVMGDGWATINLLRESVNRLGPSFLATAAARNVFGRGLQAILPLLQLNDQQFNLLAADAQRSGLILSQSQLEAARAATIAQNTLNGAITGLGSLLFTTFAPALTQFVSSVAAFIQANAQRIVSFLSQVLQAVFGFVSQLFGISLQMGNVATSVVAAGDAAQGATMTWAAFRKMMEGTAGHGGSAGRASAGIDAATRSIQRHIDAVDREIAAMDKADRRRQEREAYQQLLKDYADAQRNLSQVRGETFFAAGMSEAEAILAQQRHSAEVKDAEKRVADARRSIADHAAEQARQRRHQELEDQRSHLQKLLSAHQATMRGITASTVASTRDQVAAWRRMYQQMFGGHAAATGGGIGGSATGFGASSQALADAMKFGRDLANGLKDALFGKETTRVGGQNLITSRSGGLIDQVGHLVDGIKTLLDGMNSLFGSNTPFVLGLGAIALLGGPLGLLVAGVGALVAFLQGNPGYSKTYPQTAPPSPQNRWYGIGNPLVPLPPVRDMDKYQGPWMPGAGGDISPITGGPFDAALARFGNKFQGYGSPIEQALSNLQGQLGEGGAIGSGIADVGTKADQTNATLADGVGIRGKVPVTAADGDIGNIGSIGGARNNVGVRADDGAIGNIGSIGGARSFVGVKGAADGGRVDVMTTGTSASVNVGGVGGGAVKTYGTGGIVGVKGKVGVASSKSNAVWVDTGGNGGGGIGGGNSVPAGGTAGVSGRGAGSTVVIHMTIDRAAMREMLAGRASTSTLRPIRGT